MRWEMNTIAVPSPRSRPSRSNSRRTSSRPSAEVPSSTISVRGSCDSALAISTNCWSASASFDTRRLGAMCSMPIRANNASTRRRSSRERIWPSAPAGSWASMMFSATVKCGHSESSWNTADTPWAAACIGPASVTFSPYNRMTPLSGACTPHKIFTKVLLPAPLAPSSTWISPRRQLKSASSSATVPLKRLLMPIASSAGASAGVSFTDRGCASAMTPRVIRTESGLSPPQMFVLRISWAPKRRPQSGTLIAA